MFVLFPRPQPTGHHKNTSFGSWTQQLKVHNWLWTASVSPKQHSHLCHHTGSAPQAPKPSQNVESSLHLQLCSLMTCSTSHPPKPRCAFCFMARKHLAAGAPTCSLCPCSWNFFSPEPQTCQLQHSFSTRELSTGTGVALLLFASALTSLCDAGFEWSREGAADRGTERVTSDPEPLNLSIPPFLASQTASRGICCSFSDAPTLLYLCRYFFLAACRYFAGEFPAEQQRNYN